MAQLLQPFYRLRWVVVAGLFALLGAVADVAAQQEASPLELSVGIGGAAKLGHWLPVQFKLPADSAAAKATQFRVTVLDGDDTPVTTVGPLIKSEAGFQAVVQLGRTYGEATFELLEGENILASKTTQIRQGNNSIMELLPSTARVYACLEPESESDNANEAASLSSCLSGAFPDGVQDDDRCVSIHELDELPTVAVAWEGCETVAMLVNDQQWINSMPAETIDAIHTWVRHGGHLLLAVNPQLDSMFQDGGSLQRLVAGRVGEPVELDSSRRLAEFCSSKEPFLNRNETMSVLDLSKVAGRVALAQGDRALVVRSSLGMGEVTLIGLDPTSEQFRKWNAGKRFMQNLMRLRLGEDNSQTTSKARSGNAVRHSGYKDLVGQMKVPLERFNNLRFIRFELVALLIALYILCIGLGDWFLVGKVFKRHELTWISFPLLALLFCGIAWFTAIGSRPATIQLNQIELIDIDSIDGNVRATVWGNVYSPRGKTVDLSLGVAEIAKDRGLQLESSQLTWLGLPGDGLGGMLNRANPGLYRTGYAQQVQPVADLETADVNIDMQNVELQVSSTRPLLGKWQGKSSKRVVSRLRAGDRLEGTFTNPFNVPLRDCAIFFNDRVYLISGTFPADGDIDIRSDTNEKTVRSFLTRRARRVDEENKSQSVAWDPSDIDLTRIMRMMMFYHGSGGSGYTGLSHSFHDFIEMTPQSSLNRAILVGRISDRVSSIELDGQPADDLYDSSLSLVRVLMPVEPKTESGKR